MINVAFLLLVFFLMAAVIEPSGAAEVTPPRAQAPAIGSAGVELVVSADGTLARGTRRGRAALTGLAGERLLVRADARLEGARLIRILAELRSAGAAEVKLVAIRP